MTSYIFRVKFAVALTAILISALINSPVWAQELVISGNGSSSDSQVSLTVTSNTTVAQQNDGSIQNDVALDLNSGENSTSNNTGGDTQITTGDINLQTSIENSTNISAVSLDCCIEPPSTIMVTDNGTKSQNTVNFNQNYDTQISIYQSAQIQNRVSVSAYTGENKANDNSRGNTSIDTGNINAALSIENKNINAVFVSVPQTNSSLNIKISGNGSSSNNQANISLNNGLKVKIDNKADILNNSVWDLITGKNQVSGNTGGNVSITTGDINIVAEIINGPINTNLVKIDCCNNVDDPGNPPNNPPDENPKGGPPEPPQPPQPLDQSQPQTSPNMGSSAPSNGQVLGAMTGGQILPATGVSWTLILSILSLIMFMLGLYLRHHPGLDPGKK